MEIGEIGEECRALNPEVGQIIGKAVPASKYHNVRTEAKGLTFQSGHEAGVVAQYIMLDEKRQGVFGLRLQVRFPLAGGNVYVADFTYADEHLCFHVCDAKGTRTKEYLIKKRLFHEKYGRTIEEL